MTTKQIDAYERIGKLVRSGTITTYKTDASPKAPPAWVWFLLAAFCIALAFLDGGVRW
jgi:hypothetical protein